MRGMEGYMRGVNLGGWLSQFDEPAKEHFDSFITQEDIRRIAPDHFLLVPGVGAQGGSLHEVCQYGMNADCGLLVNSSRGIIYASSDDHFAEIAGNKARELQQEMDLELRAHGI